MVKQIVTIVDVYDILVDAGCTLDNHESDLYVKVDETSTKIIRKYAGDTINTFYGTDDKLWYDLPFAYVPWWDAKCKITREK